jgi:NADP-dependent 3-hydroxy acid dehydrogenase YdfG
MTPEDIASATLFIASQRDRTAVAELAISMVNEMW